MALLVVLAGCGDNLDPAPEQPPDGGAAIDADTAALPDADTSFAFARCDQRRMPLPPLVEDRTVYQQEALDVWTVRLTVPDLDGLAAVNDGVEGAAVPVTFTEGSFGAAAIEPNGTLKIRGASSRTNRQKNYKVKLESEAGLWRGQREINLNKHMWDLTRLRNKMAFDIFQTVPHLTSLRTQFVHMFVNGEDYGLYTWIEEADKRFLDSHGLDPEGQLYKVAGFEFHTIEPATAADPEAFALIVEDKANADDAKFLRMNEAVNDWSRDIDDVVATYFDRDNLITWLAVNVLLNNIDTRTQNYYLYSPSSCEGWYFLPWDYDGAWSFYGQLQEDNRDRWESGLSNWWEVTLFERFYAKPANVEAIDDRITELSQTSLTDEITAARIASYRDLIQPHISVPPDLTRLPGQESHDSVADAIRRWDAELTRISTTVSRFLAEYHTVIERPMPSRVAATRLPSSELRLRWNESFDLQHDPVHYDVQVSTTSMFAPQDIVIEQLGIIGDEITVPSPPPGTYYWRVIIRDERTGEWQLPFDPYKLVEIQ